MNTHSRNSPRKSAQAWTLVELLVVLGILAVLAALLVPTRHGHWPLAPRIACVNNLKQVGLSFHTFSQDYEGHFPMQVSVTNGGAMESAATGSVFMIFQVMSNELSTPKISYCPADEQRISTNNFPGLTDANLSYFVGLDATTNAPSSTLLSGDRNLTNQPSRGSRFVNVSKTTALGWTKELHARHGNLLFADGSVMAYDNKDVKANSQMPNGVTNRLVLP